MQCWEVSAGIFSDDAHNRVIGILTVTFIFVMRRVIEILRGLIMSWGALMALGGVPTAPATSPLGILL